MRSFLEASHNTCRGAGGRPRRPPGAKNWVVSPILMPLAPGLGRVGREGAAAPGPSRNMGGAIYAAAARGFLAAPVVGVGVL